MGSDMPTIERADLIADLRAKALRARLHAIYMVDQEAADKLNKYSEELEAQVAKLVDE
jgi:hypothetical protein